MASSVIQHICSETFAVTVDEVQVADMKESAGMVFVQSLKELGRYCYSVVLTCKRDCYGMHNLSTECHCKSCFIHLLCLAFLTELFQVIAFE